MRDFIDTLPFVDHHCHGIVSRDLDREGFEALMSEGHRPVAGCTQFDKPLGLMIGRWCAPALGLETHADPARYLARRGELGAADVARRLAGGTGVSLMLIDTGHRAQDILDPAQMTRATGIDAREVVRIEALMEEAARSGVTTGSDLLQAFDALLVSRSRKAVGLKSIVAYRTTFDIDQSRPSDTQARGAGDGWLGALRSGAVRRLDDAVLIRFALWRAGEICRDRGFPLQLHVGFGDRDIVMPKCDPTLFTPFISAMEDWDVPITLLHCYPFIREAAWLAEVFSNVYIDIGVIQNFSGPAAPRILAEAMEIAPFYKQLYSSDAFGLPELHFLGAKLFRHALTEVLGDWIREGNVTVRRAELIASAISHENSRRIYPIG